MEEALADPDLCSRWGRRGRERALASFSIEAQARRTADAYRRSVTLPKEPARASALATHGAAQASSRAGRAQGLP
jgi:hypothetical protein